MQAGLISIKEHNGQPVLVNKTNLAKHIIQCSNSKRETKPATLVVDHEAASFSGEGLSPL